ncbi:unnamed protein product [Phytophthora fragariaefolia]|uniref:separase n=1 Tax=Phytophthora fragariaefolia TaxID=1490495 RepID=A0A9W6XEL6_9STRA|nr:unnamed protein product [Phytophthora fragariaefolia]
MSGDDTAKRSNLMEFLGKADEVETDLASTVMQQLKLVADFPEPMSYHSEQFTRLLLGHVNTCVSLLVAGKHHEVVLAVAESVLSRWIEHLQNFPGQNSKLASSFSDRTFRVLWKCAGAAGAVKPQSSETASTALRFRSTALIFLLKCSNYTASYFIQQVRGALLVPTSGIWKTKLLYSLFSRLLRFDTQVHRIGVQHERATKRSHQGLREVYALYAREADALARTASYSTLMYTSESLQWEYIYWLEHFASICDVYGLHLKSAMILDSAVQYAKLFGSLGTPIQAYLLISIAGMLFSAAGSTEVEISRVSQSECATTSFDCRLLSCTGKLFRDLFNSTASSKKSEQCEMAARVYLKKVEAITPYSFVGLGSQEHVIFLTRCLKRSTTKAYNYAMKKLRSAATNIKLIETMILEESRLHRMAVILLVRCCVVVSPTAAKSGLDAVSQHVTSVRELLDAATVDNKPSASIMQGILGDLNSIARECYSCATRLYKAEKYQDTISALIGAFDLAESYLEYVMCSNLTNEDMHQAHVQLKVDAIASLLAHCFHEVGNAKKSREFTGHSLLYCGDIRKVTLQPNINKYVSCILEELNFLGVNMKASLVEEFKAFVDSTAHVYKARHIPEKQTWLLWASFRSAFEQASAKLMMSGRANGHTDLGDIAELPFYTTVDLCCALENYLDGVLVGLKKNFTECNDTLLDVSRSMAKRKLLFCAYYIRRDFNCLIEGLLDVRRSLSAAVEKLDKRLDVFDLGGIYGWRGVITLELALATSYARTTHVSSIAGDSSISEDNAISDIEQCLLCWGDRKDTFGCLFDETHVINCLESICNALSLVSCSATKKAASTLLKAFGASESFALVPPLMLDIVGEKNTNIVSNLESQSVGQDCKNHGFELLDKEICAAKVSVCDYNTVQACQHLVRAMTTLGSIKLDTKQRSISVVAKATGMRELLVHIILSDIHFLEGRSKLAITEAKSALRICLKIAKKFAAPSTTVAGCFDLAPEISNVQWLQRKSANAANFMALESSSWDLLYAAKLSLCRVASFYSYSDEPHRAASYLAEAMRLVGGLNLNSFRRAPIYEYAELELNANHLENAKTAVSLLLSTSTQEILISRANECKLVPKSHGIHSDWAFIEQFCDEVVQQGDVHLAGHDKQKALSCYEKAIKVLTSFQTNGSPGLNAFTRVQARSWRKYSYLQSEISDLTDPSALEGLLNCMKTLKRLMKICGSRLERVKCMLTLGRINMNLLRSSSPRAFASLERTVSLMEEAYLLGDHLGINHLSRELRTTLAMAYFAEIEESACNDAGHIDGGEQTTFLAWASGALLANASCIRESDATDSDIGLSAKDGLMKQLEELAARPCEPPKSPPCRRNVTETIDKISGMVQQLPSNWIIVSLAIGLSSELVITRFQCWKLLISRRTGAVKLSKRNQSLLCAIADAQHWLSDNEVIDGMKHIAAEINAPLSDSEAREALQLLRQLGQQPKSPTQVNRSNYSRQLLELRTDRIEKLKVGELKQLLAAEGLSTDGLKRVLVERLVSGRDAALVASLNPAPSDANENGFSTILILNHQLHHFPWEGMDIMRSCSGVTRMPSLDLILQNVGRPRPPTSTSSLIRRDRVRFLLNPAGDLVSTQNQLGPLLDGGVATYGWEGVVGEIPDPSKLR